MTRLVSIKNLFVVLALSFFSIGADAYEDDKGKELCRDPKIQEFNLPEYNEPEKKEVPPEAEFSFVISGWSDPKKIKIEAKGIKIPYTVESSETFHRVKSKLPAELTGKFVRLSVRIPAVLGCYTTQGWLLKVADKAGAAEAPKPSPSPSSEEKTVTPEAKGETKSDTTVADKPLEPAAQGESASTSAPDME